MKFKVTQLKKLSSEESLNIEEDYFEQDTIPRLEYRSGNRFLGYTFDRMNTWFNCDCHVLEIVED